MDWMQLLTEARPHGPTPAASNEYRSPFQKDFDRIVYSFAFRRMQDKTQVHSFPETDYVRKRLTHCMEVGCIGRSLGFGVGKKLIKLHPELMPTTEVASPSIPERVSQIVYAACVAHDIGNSPFGHTGDAAIAEWFQSNPKHPAFEELSPDQKKDFSEFDGNAQGFRILTQLEDRQDDGGLQLTGAVLGTYSKYPRGSFVDPTPGHSGHKKHGFLVDDRERFAKLAGVLGLQSLGPNKWARHPLAYLVVAADDIAYRIVDLEDALRLKIVSHDKYSKVLQEIVGEKIPSWLSEDDSVGWLRGQAIGCLINAVVDTFKAREVVHSQWRRDG